PAGEEGTFFGLTAASSAAFSFQRPADMASGKVNGEEGLWIRALLTSDDPYGREAFILPGATLTVVQSTLVPPVVIKAALSFKYKAALTAVDHVVTENNFAQIDHALGGTGPVYPVQPFVALPDAPLPGGVDPAFAADGALYLGFDRPFGDVYISLYVKLRDVFPSVGQPAEQGHPLVTWEYLAAGPQWKPLDVADDTSDLTSSGTVSFLGPDDLRATVLFGAPAVSAATPPLCWLRARLAGGSYDYPPTLQGIFPNTVMSDNRLTFRDDVVIGSGSGEPNQRFTLLKAPVLSGDLWVREPEPPPRAELDDLLVELRADQSSAGAGTGTGAGSPLDSETDILQIRTPAAPPASNIANPSPSREVWVRWRRVPNFLGSGPRSRHYALDPLSGVLLLGDGKLQGLLPPVAKDNLVIRNYRTGGGEAATRVAVPLAVKELKSSLPYVEKVFNVEAATGGSDPWDLAKIFHFGPQLLKNKGRAVSAEDFEWMVLQQFSQVARAKCLSTRAPGPGGLVMKPGAVTVVVVPRGIEREPRPSGALLRQIADFLAERCLGGIVSDIHALGPGFFPITVRARIHARDPRESSDVERRAVQALENFFHPLSGGEQGAGWPFGRDVQVSEVFAQLQRVEGVDHVARVDLIKGTGTGPMGQNDLLSSGSHTIEMI
ncbi:MAG: putative baseplate assembly protein, partial [Pseudomonadota bacterium]